jgi:murein DD-endopeptidase MepM/ murein hydrolase activator NlpD
MFAGMKKIHLFLSFVLLFACFFVSGQRPIPTDYFSSPLGIDLSVTGSFGEIRPNHLHSGTDFQVQKKEGLPVYAIADGWVSRIKISPVGFGNALYIDHPNGFTSVYGHLSGYNDTISRYSRMGQYRRKAFEVDIFPANDHDTLWVKKGDVIGFAGNSGSSFGAHLHFELRNTETERIINPLLFGFNCRDNFSPYIDFIKIYPVGKNSYIKGCNQPVQVGVGKPEAGEYRLLGCDTLDLWGEFGFGVQAFDYLYSSSDRNGWYSIKMYYDKALFFTMQLDSFAFNETRFINASLDYTDSYLNGSRIVQSIRLPGNELSLHKTGKSDGIVSFEDGKPHEIVISVGDVSGKLAVARFIARSRKPSALVDVPSPEVPDTVMFFPYSAENRMVLPDISVQLPAGSLFDDTWFTYSRLPRRKGTFSNRHAIHQPEYPLKGKITVAIKADALPSRLRSKALMARIDGDGQIHSAGGGYANGYVSAETNLFDCYAIIADTIPPRIKLLRDRNRHKSSLKFSVSDNLSGIDTYYAEINKKWALVQWDPKNDLMVYKYDDMLKHGKNLFKLVLIDKKGNKSSYNTIIRK